MVMNILHRDPLSCSPASRLRESDIFLNLKKKELHSHNITGQLIKK
jgi:hypothetical protein